MLSDADLVKALRCCARYAYNCEGCVAFDVCEAQDYFGVEKIAADRIEELIADVNEWIAIFDMLNDRENRHKYLDWWRKRYRESDLAYPDGDQIYKDFWWLMRIARKMHTWIFLHTFDEQEVYDELGLTDEENAFLGYGGQFVLSGTEDSDG